MDVLPTNPTVLARLAHSLGYGPTGRQEFEEEQLRQGQSGPVHMLDEISRSLPDMLWLTEMSQKGQEITLAGMTTSMTGLSDLIAGLESSRWFRKPVDIIDSQVASDPKSGDLVKFSVKATFHNPDAPPAPAPAGARR